MMDPTAVLATAIERGAWGQPDPDGYPSAQTQDDMAAILELLTMGEGEETEQAAEHQPEVQPVSYIADGEALLYESHHAPAGGVNLAGRQYVGGEFIPAEQVARATPEERKQLNVKRSLPEKIKAAPAALKAALSPESIDKAVSSILNRAKHPVRTAGKARDAAKAKLAAIYDKYGAVGVAAIASAYVAYYAVAAANPVMLTVPVPLTATIFTCAEMVRRGVKKIKGTPKKPEPPSTETVAYARFEGALDRLTQGLKERPLTINMPAQTYNINIPKPDPVQVEVKAPINVMPAAPVPRQTMTIERDADGNIKRVVPEDRS